MLDVVETAAVSEAEVTTQTELERQANDAARDFALARYRAERAEQAAYHLAAQEGGRLGARWTAPELHAACGAAVSLAVKGFRMRLTDDLWAEARAEVLMAALDHAARCRASEEDEGAARAERRMHEREDRAISRRWLLGGYSAMRRAEEEAARVTYRRADHAALPFRGDAEDADGLGLSYLARAARNVIADIVAADRPGRERRESLAEHLEDAAQWTGDLSARDIANHLPGGKLTTAEWTALRVNVDGEALADLAAEDGRKVNAVKQAAHKGRASLAKRLETPGAAHETALRATGEADSTLEPNPGETVLQWIARAEDVLQASEDHATELRMAAERRNIEEDAITSAASAGPILRSALMPAAMAHRARTDRAARQARRYSKGMGPISLALQHRWDVAEQERKLRLMLKLPAILTALENATRWEERAGAERRLRDLKRALAERPSG